MRSFLRDLRRITLDYFIVSACFLPWAAGSAVRRLYGGPPWIEAVLAALGVATTAYVSSRWGVLFRDVRRPQPRSILRPVVTSTNTNLVLVCRLDNLAIQDLDTGGFAKVSIGRDFASVVVVRGIIDDVTSHTVSIRARNRPGVEGVDARTNALTWGGVWVCRHPFDNTPEPPLEARYAETFGAERVYAN